MREVEVWRGAHSKDEVSKEKGVYVLVYAGGAHASDSRRGLKISFSIASKGGGKTSLSVWMGSSCFEEILGSMIEADPAAFKNALSKTWPDA